MALILQRENSDLLYKAFCGCCGAKRSIPVPNASGVGVRSWIDRCPAGFQVGRRGCIKARYWQAVQEALEGAHGL